MPIREKTYQNLLKLSDAARKYHRHEAFGLENIPKEGPAMLVVNHSLATYDIFMLWAAIYADYGRITRCLVDRLLFQLPYIKGLVDRMGLIEAGPNAAKDVLNNQELLCVAPGGMRELLKPSSQRYQIHWDDRKGFAKLAIETGVPVILAACPKADDLYDVFSNKFITGFAYRRLHIPLTFTRGFGPTFLPRPVKLTHHLSEAIIPPKLQEGQDARELVDEFHNQLVAKMRILMAQGVQFGSSSPVGK